MPPLISVITATYNRRELLLRKLESLKEQSLEPQGFEAVVLVNGSKDGTLAALDAVAFPFALKVIAQEKNLGSARGRNAAARAAEGAILLMSDDDCLLTPQVLAAHLEAHQRYGHAVVVGPTKLAEGLRSGRLAEPFEGVQGLGRRALWIHATGTNSSMPRRAFEEVGGYDETFSAYGGEDPSLALKLRAHGLRFRFAPEAVVYHLGRQLEGDFSGRAFSAGRAQWRVYKQHPSLEVGLMLGVHPLLLGVKRLVFSELVASRIAHPRYHYERAYYEGALEEKRRGG